MEFLLGSIRMIKANGKVVRLDAVTLNSDKAYELVFLKHPESTARARVQADLLSRDQQYLDQQ